MKYFLLIAALASGLAACNKQDGGPTPPVKTPAVEISFAGLPVMQTRAFFDPTATAESWEKALQKITVLVFAPDGNLLLERRFTAAELTAQTATFAVPNLAEGLECRFVAVANREVGGLGDLPGLAALTESGPGDYNSTFAQVSSTANRAGGFVMTGSETARIASGGAVTPVALTLRRCVAKIAVRTEPTAQFAARYPGKIRILSAKLSGAASASRLMPQPSPATGGMGYTHVQAPETDGAAFCNLFYVYENAALPSDGRLKLELSAAYDRDGDFATTGDQASLSYTVPLEGNGDGSFDRNGYYRIAVALDGLTGSDITASVTVADWIVPATQYVNLGQ